MCVASSPGAKHENDEGGRLQATRPDRARGALEVPSVGPRDALLRVTATTICGTDVHILKGEYPVKPGLIVGHEPVGVIEELGPGVTGFRRGERVIVGAITPCGQCHSCLSGCHSQCGGTRMGGWRLGNTIDGCQAEYVLVPTRMANLAPIPDGLTRRTSAACARTS